MASVLCRKISSRFFAQAGSTNGKWVAILELVVFRDFTTPAPWLVK